MLKRKSVKILSLALLFSIALSSAAYADFIYYPSTQIYSEDFQSYAADSKPANTNTGKWEDITETGGPIKITGNSDRSLKLHKPDNIDSKVGLNLGFKTTAYPNGLGNNEKIVSVSFRFKTDEAGTGQKNLRIETNNSTAVDLMYRNKVFRATLAKDVFLTFKKECGAGQWYDIRVEINTVTDKFDIWIDNEKIEQTVDAAPVNAPYNLQNNKTMDNVTRLMFYMNGSGNYGSIYIDDILVNTIDTSTSTQATNRTANTPLANAQCYTPAVDTYYEKGSSEDNSAKDSLLLMGQKYKGNKEVYLKFNYPDFAYPCADNAVLKLFINGLLFPKSNEARYIKLYSADSSGPTPVKKEYLTRYKLTSAELNKWITFNVADHINEKIAGKTTEFIITVEGNSDISPNFITSFDSAENINKPSLEIVGASSPPYNFSEMMKPEWEGDIAYNESVMPVKYEDQPLAYGNLLFNAVEIISVKDYTLKTAYAPNTDWIYQDGKIIIPAGSAITPMNYTDLYGPSNSDKYKTDDGEHIKVNESGVFQQNQLFVTYRHTSRWESVIPKTDGLKLKNTIKKLHAGQPVTIVSYGDSITSSANESQFKNLSPYLPSWGNLFVKGLKEFFPQADITYYNYAVPGTRSEWGAQYSYEIGAVKPDLLILAFGMNDRNVIGQEDFKENLNKIISDAKNENPNAEVILVSPIKPNPSWSNRGNINEYQATINQLYNELSNAAFADITAAHGNILQVKNYEEITGNNINHPNDYINRLYAKMALKAICTKAIAEKSTVTHGENTVQISVSEDLVGSSKVYLALLEDGILKNIAIAPVTEEQFEISVFADNSVDLSKAVIKIFVWNDLFTPLAEVY